MAVSSSWGHSGWTYIHTYIRTYVHTYKGNMGMGHFLTTRGPQVFLVFVAIYQGSILGNYLF